MNGKDFLDVASWIACVKNEIGDHKGQLAATDKEAFQRAKQLYNANADFDMFNFYYDAETGKDGPPPLAMAAFRMRYGFGCADTKDAVLVEPGTGISWVTGGLREIVPIPKHPEPGTVAEAATTANVVVYFKDGKPEVKLSPPGPGWEDDLMRRAHEHRMAMARAAEAFEKKQRDLEAGRANSNAIRLKAAGTKQRKARLATAAAGRAAILAGEAGKAGAGAEEHKQEESGAPKAGETAAGPV